MTGSGFCYFISLLMIILIVPGQTSAQGQYLERGHDGIGISGTLSGGQGAYSIGGSFGASIAATLDIGIAASWLNSTEIETKFIAIAPGLTLHAVKQNGLIPISFAAGVSYEITRAQQSANHVNTDLTSFNYLIALYRSFHLPNGGQFIPEAGIVYTDPKTDESNLDNITSYLIGINIVAPRQNGKRLFLNPGILFNKDDSVISISIGVLLNR